MLSSFVLNSQVFLFYNKKDFHVPEGGGMYGTGTALAYTACQLVP
jgi:hypothetical protein